MNYSFFGTCSNDYEQFFGCLSSILEQTFLPKEIILVNSGNKNIEKEILNKIHTKHIRLIYISKKLNRVKSLNIALDKSNSKYSFRFDTRTRFSKKYAENALKLLNDQSLDISVVGGCPRIICESKNFEAQLCSEIMQRGYLFFYPKHRDIKFSGYSSSIYLGCFDTKLLKEIRFNEKKALLSEDSLIINDFLEKGFKAYICSSVEVYYLCRSSFLNILKLFNTYGYCRANTIYISKKIFISKRHLYLFIIILFIFLLLLKISFFSLFLEPIILFLFNLFGELFYKGNLLKIYLPFYATLCQLSWMIGFFWQPISIFKNKSTQSNFIS